ncbi:MAG: hypothetical protein E6I18_02300 [Chloroflexi bacterium]|nr:MAG: hypothetical protein E6I18_02300 [Chloroflexota bacterium]
MAPSRCDLAVAKGQGKGWAKGLSALSDPRVARAAAAHRGLRYERRTPLSECKWFRGSSTILPLCWSDEMAYVVGLTATDGCLVGSRPRIDFKSMDRQLVEIYLAILGRTDRIAEVPTQAGGVVFVVQITDRNLYDWFRSVGLSPRKSLTIGSIDAPDEVLFPLARGLLDGDGSIVNGIWRADTTRRSDYYWECLRTKFVSGSRKHVEWLHARLRAALPLRGWITRKPYGGVWALIFGKADSLRLLPRLYPDVDVPCLLRKRAIWEDYLRRHEGIANNRS